MDFQWGRTSKETTEGHWIEGDIKTEYKDKVMYVKTIKSTRTPIKGVNLQFCTLFPEIQE